MIDSRIEQLKKRAAEEQNLCNELTQEQHAQTAQWVATNRPIALKYPNIYRMVYQRHAWVTYGGYARNAR